MTDLTSKTPPPADLAPRLLSRDPDDFAVPHGREEEWRFTPLRRLAGLHDTATADARLRIDADAAAPATVEVVGRDDVRLGASFVPADRVAARAWAGFDQAVVVSVPAGTQVAGATTVRLVGEGGTSFGHVVVQVGSDAEAIVVLDHSGSARHAGTVEVDLGDRARLTLVSVHEWDDDAVHLGHQHLRIGRDAALTSLTVTLGGDVVRVTSTVEYAGPGGEVDLLGAFFADAGQHLEHRLFVDHAVPHCRSNVVYKGALQGEGAHSVWVGDVLIRAAAVGTDTYEINRNLILTDGARADSVPNLEIETGEVAGAGHASATGRFDDEQLFYLQARGIPEDEARRLVVRGFFAELVARVRVPEVRERLLAAVDAELGAGDPRFRFDDTETHAQEEL